MNQYTETFINKYNWRFDFVWSVNAGKISIIAADPVLDTEYLSKWNMCGFCKYVNRSVKYEGWEIAAIHLYSKIKT